MKVVALVSGGKDSCYNIMQCVAAGHTIVALANLEPQNHHELDSYMYQSVGHEGVALMGDAMGLPLYRQTTHGKAEQLGRDYIPTENDEVEDLYELLHTVKRDIPIEGVAVGAILSDYQRVRVENVCSRLGLIALAYLWRRDQKELLNEMIDCGIQAVIIKVAALGLDPMKHLGVPLQIARQHLLRMNDKYGLHVCGEGGEYETFTLDCPLYTSAVVVDQSDTIIHSNDAIAPVGYLRLRKLHLSPKDMPSTLEDRLNGISIKDPNAYIADIDDEDTDLRTRSSSEESDSSFSSEPVPFSCISESTEIDYNNPPSYARSYSGWLWIGGITGCSDEPITAMSMALDKLQNCLEENNLTIQDVCAVTMYVSEMGLYIQLNEMYCQTFHYLNPPARVCVQCPLPNTCPIMLDVLAFSRNVRNSVSPSESDNTPNISPCESKDLMSRFTMHVQGISHWAPANIGPYSQAVQVGDIIRVAGQIGLVPGSMQLVDGGVRRQCRLSLRHVGRIISAMNSKLQLRDVVQGVCYVTHPNFVRPARQEWEKRTNNAIVDYLVVDQLPRGALVEWHLWAHTHNNQFEYEETGKRFEDYLLSIRRRWNYENKVAAVVCYIEHIVGISDETVLSSELTNVWLEYALSKLNQDYTSNIPPVCNLRIYYSVSQNINVVMLNEIFRQHRAINNNIVYTIVPVCQLQNEKLLLSICGVRYE